MRRFDAAYDANNDRVYMLGFEGKDWQVDGSIWYYDLKENRFGDTHLDLRVPIKNYGIAALHDGNGDLALYAFGGTDAHGVAVRDVQAYYPKWRIVADYVATDPWPGRTPSSCTSLPAMGVTVSDNKAYVLGGFALKYGGCGVDDNSSETWIFDPKAPPGTRWTRGPDLNLARGYVTPAVYHGTIYAIGGDVNDGGTLRPQAIVEAWKPPHGGWRDADVADLPEPCDESQAFSFDHGDLAKSIILAGCGQWPDVKADTLQYEVGANDWAIVGSLNEPRRNHAGTLIRLPGPGNRVAMFVLGGERYGDADRTSELARNVSSLNGARPPSDPASSYGRGPPTV